MSNYGRRAAGTSPTEEQLAELRALAQMPDSEIDFSDIPERILQARQDLPLEPHTVTLRVDSEVAAWLEQAGERNASRINWLLKRESRRTKEVSAQSSSVLHQAS